MNRSDYTTTERLHSGVRVTIIIGDNRYSRLYIGYSTRAAVREAWRNMEPVAYIAVGHGCYCGAVVLGVDYGIDDRLIIRDQDGRVTSHTINYSAGAGPWITYRGRRVYLESVMRYA